MESLTVVEMEEVRPDEFYPLTINDGETYIVNAKYDRIDYIPRLGAWMLKIYDDEVGLITMHLGETEAMKVADVTELPVVPRDWIYESEYDGWIDAQASLLTDEMFGGFNEGFEDGES